MREQKQQQENPLTVAEQIELTLRQGLEVSLTIKPIGEMSRIDKQDPRSFHAYQNKGVEVELQLGVEILRFGPIDERYKPEINNAEGSKAQEVSQAFYKAFNDAINLRLLKSVHEGESPLCKKMQEHFEATRAEHHMPEVEEASEEEDELPRLSSPCRRCGSWYHKTPFSAGI